MAIKIQIDDWLGWKIANIDGEFTTKALVEVKSLLEDLEKTGSLRIAIDLSKSSFIDAAAIQLMINYYKKIVGKGGRLKILSPSEDALDILKMLCVKELTDICISRESFERSC
jgi:anti-anti-sigma factor